MEPKTAIIVAKASDNGIGCSDGLPWHIPAELKYFKRRTKGKPVIMGRKTYESIVKYGGPLPDRTNIVISRNGFEHTGADVCSSLEEAISMAKKIAKKDGKEEIFVIGGVQIFKLAIPLADIIYLTKIDSDSALPPNAWLEESDIPNKIWEVKDETIEVLEEKINGGMVNCHFQVLEKKVNL